MLFNFDRSQNSNCLLVTRQNVNHSSGATGRNNMFFSFVLDPRHMHMYTLNVFVSRLDS